MKVIIFVISVLAGFKSVYAAEVSPFDLELTPDSNALETLNSKPISPSNMGQSSISTAIQNANPDISFVADFLAGNKAALTQKGDPAKRPIDIREVEIDGNGYISPYAKGNFVVSFSAGGADVEEAFMNFFTLPGGLNLKLGKFRVDTDTLNPTHQHAIPFVDQPLVFHHAFGEEGLKTVGANASMLVPNPLNQYLIASFSLGVNTFESDQYTSLYGGNTNSVLGVGRLGTSIDFSSSTYLTLNTSATLAPLVDQSVSRIYIAEAMLRIAINPVNNTITCLNGFLWNHGNPNSTGAFDTNGFYNYLGWQFSQNWKVGARYDHTNNATFDGKENQYTAVLSYYPTETNFIRIQYAAHEMPETFLHTAGTENRIWLQIDFSMGPHQQHTAL